MNQDSKIIFSCIGDVDFRTMAKSFTKQRLSVEVVFYQPKDYEAIQILNTKANELNLKCGISELGYLYNMHQKDLSLCANDLKKLLILDRSISVNIINQQCFGMGAISLDEFFIKLFTGVNINKDLYMLLEEGMNEINLINQTTAFIQQLFIINSYLKLYGQLNVKEIWGYNLPSQIADARAKVAIRYKQDQFLDMLNIFQSLELELKTKTSLDINSYTQACFRKFSASLR